ncbi:MAG: hypothetical protein WKF36_00370 [Candidatus Nitrosocosmicus sp.]
MGIAKQFIIAGLTNIMVNTPVSTDGEKVLLALCLPQGGRLPDLNHTSIFS